MSEYFDKPRTATGAIASVFKPKAPGLLLIAFLAAITAIILASASTAIAQTPDGETPAQESVCDVLQANGTSKGLYGLCVAFCEAHDAADENTAMTQTDMDEMLMNGPHGRILRNYNRKKTDTDPDMPCVKVEEPCPCWTAELTDSIDGLSSDGSTITLSAYNVGQHLNIQEFGYAPQFESNAILSITNHGNALGFCQGSSYNFNTSPIISEAVTLYYYGAGHQDNSFTAQQHEACRASVAEVQTRNGF